MVETEKMSGTRVVFNRGIREYHTSKGILKPQTSIELPEKEAKDMLDYSDIIDHEKVAPGQSSKVKQLQQENQELKDKLAKKESEPEPESEPESPAESSAPAKKTKEVTAKKRKK